MGRLTGFLQSEFAAHCPSGWRCRHEVHLLSPKLNKLLGYAPRADVVLETEDGAKRIWIEFEVSRADPVANHAKFATSHLFQPQPQTDTFVAMVSSHVARGRRNLASNTIMLMRHIGMNAHQTLLFPTIAPNDIKRLNHLPLERLRQESLDTRFELERALVVSEPLAMTTDYRIHFAGELIDVIYNLLSWNQEVQTPAGQALWKKRSSMYFVYDPQTKLFAPSKYCAFLDASTDKQIQGDDTHRNMTMEIYTSLDESEPRFDGNRAQLHLQKHLGMVIVSPGDNPVIDDDFDDWKKTNSSVIRVHGKGAKFLVPPLWFN